MKNKKIFREKIMPTRFDGYYVSEDGRVFTEKSISTRTTHKEELEYLGITLGELIRFGAQEIKKFFRRGKIPQRLIYNWKRIK